ncbi:DUF3618 domain-containing protein [Mesorhizobium sp. BAC0120]|uniref:DUF3618 domain-containing protein n=1 Tax=Mesorhizobium sp. BAC0120 TaxID=3090670 RepID=UPI00298C2DEF|nr:DUF3618 domain-containing protein [Mesorhizobium sp. BAC0120]MDW6020566.1 DUF3618 domain-containing protein [Mesorhizobium sp. BAC0120]
MSTNGHQSSHDIEHDVEETRARMAETLDELRARMSPGQMLDEVLDYAKGSGGGRMMQNLGRTLQDNPAPLLVIGAGIAWMMAAARPGGRSYSPSTDQRRFGDGPDRDFRAAASDWTGGGGREWANSARDTARRAGEQISDSVSSATDSAVDTAASVRDAAADTAAGVRDAAAGVRDAAAQSMQDMRDTAYRTSSAAYSNARDFASSAADMLRDQPFVFGALGVALGAALGAALPETDLEDDLMGEASDAVKQQASEAGAAGYEKAKAVAEKTWESASQEAERQGLTADKAKEALDNLGEKANSVRETSVNSARDEASRQGLMSNESDKSGSQDARPGSEAS